MCGLCWKAYCSGKSRLVTSAAKRQSSILKYSWTVFREAALSALLCTCQSALSLPASPMWDNKRRQQREHIFIHLSAARFLSDVRDSWSVGQIHLSSTDLIARTIYLLFQVVSFCLMWPCVSICQVLHLLHSCSRTNTMYVWVFPLYWIAAVAHSSFIVFARYVQQNCEIRIELWSWDAVTECTATLSQPDLSAEHVFWCNLCLHLNNESRVLASPGLFCMILLLFLLSLGCIKYK